MTNGYSAKEPVRHILHHIKHSDVFDPFGSDEFGQAAERFARFFGTPKFIVIQTALVIMWIGLNAAELLFKPFDPYPYILLNLCFSTQAAYAAPLILLAQTRQADRDKVQSAADAQHREDLANIQSTMLEANTVLTKKVYELTEALHELAKRQS